MNDYIVPALGAGMDMYNAWFTGKELEDRTAFKWSETRNDISRMEESSRIKNYAKDQQNTGGYNYAQKYLWEGQQKLKALEKQVEDNNSQLLLQHNIAYEQSAAVEEVTANIMSRNAIDAMKAEARLRAGAAGSGTEGGSTNQAKYQARAVEMFDNAIVIGRSTAQKVGIQRRLQMQNLSVMNRNKYIMSQAGSIFGLNGASAAYEKGKALTSATQSNALKSGYVPKSGMIYTPKVNKLNSAYNLMSRSGLIDLAVNFYDEQQCKYDPMSCF